MCYENRTSSKAIDTDRFGNPHAPNLPYARGKILATTEDDFRKLQRAWSLIRERGPGRCFHIHRARTLAADEQRGAPLRR